MEVKREAKLKPEPDMKKKMRLIADNPVEALTAALKPHLKALNPEVIAATLCQSPETVASAILK
jgi:hypothetical protein